MSRGNGIFSARGLLDYAVKLLDVPAQDILVLNGPRGHRAQGAVTYAGQPFATISQGNVQFTDNSVRDA